MSAEIVDISPTTETDDAATNPLSDYFEQMAEEDRPAWAQTYLATPPRLRGKAMEELTRLEARDYGQKMWRLKQFGAAESSWLPQDFEDILADTYVEETADLMPRADGHGLIYRGRVHSFHGESESGKSFILQAESARILIDGGRVLFLDFESDRASVVRRLLGFGASADHLRAGFVYVHPEEPPGSKAWEGLLRTAWDLVVIDGVTDAMNVLGYALNGDLNDQTTQFMRGVPKRIADETGAAVVLVDHVTKSNDARGRFAIGAQAKLSGLTGAAYTVEVTDALKIGGIGEIVLRIGKDRPGGVRKNCSPHFKVSDRTQEAARIKVDSTGPIVRVIVNIPKDMDPTAMPDRPTTLMHRVSDFLLTQTKPVSQNMVATSVTGQRAAKIFALECLVEDGFVERTEGSRGLLYALRGPYITGNRYVGVDEEEIFDEDPL